MDIHRHRHRVLVGILLTVLLVVEGLQLEELLVDPSAALRHGGRVVEFRVKGGQVQLHLPAVNPLLGVQVVHDKLRVRGA